MLIARYSNHINEDLQRGWSSWNFGEDGIFATEQDMKKYLSEISDESPLPISGFEIYAHNVDDFQIKQLYPGYWVVVDNVNACGMLSCVELESETLEEAIEEYENKSYTGDGDCFDAESAELLWSSPCGEYHILEVN